jgi:hypothetical protein
MRRSTLVLALAALMATTMALTVGSALATNTNLAQNSYTDTFTGFEYKAAPGEARFRATVEGDLPGALDATIYYTEAPGPNVTNTITEGTWIFCEQFTDPPRGAMGNLIEPQCTSDSKTSLTGTWSSGTATWEANGLYVPSPRGPLWIGKAEVTANLTVTDGKADDVSVNGGSGEVHGTLDHTPILSSGRATVTGTMKLTPTAAALPTATATPTATAQPTATAPATAPAATTPPAAATPQPATTPQPLP